MIIEDRHYDVIVIGTGAGGATLAAELADGGRSVLVLERGQSIPAEELRSTGTELFRKERFHPKESWFGTDGDRQRRFSERSEICHRQRVVQRIRAVACTSYERLDSNPVLRWLMRSAFLGVVEYRISNRHCFF